MMPPPQQKNFCTQGEYFTISNGAFNFNFIALVSEILGGPKFTLGDPAPPGRSMEENFCTESEYFTICNGVIAPVAWFVIT